MQTLLARKFCRIKMKRKITVTTLLLGILLFAAIAMASIISPDLAVDLGEWTGAYGHAKGTVDRVTAYPLSRKSNLSQANEFPVAGFTEHLPAPSTMLLFGFGLIGLAGVGRKFTKNQRSQ